MSAHDTRKLASILRSIEVIESKFIAMNDQEKSYFLMTDKTNIIYSEYTASKNDIDRSQSLHIDDTSTHLQVFFQHLEQLLQIDLRSKNE